MSPAWWAGPAAASQLAGHTAMSRLAVRHIKSLGLDPVEVSALQTSHVFLATGFPVARYADRIANALSLYILAFVVTPVPCSPAARQR